MPTLDEHQSNDVFKGCLIGDSGEGKSGALASLAHVGYNLRIIDMDNGLDYLKNVLRKESPDSLKRVVYETLTNKMQGVMNKFLPVGTPNAWSRMTKLLTKWEVGTPGQPGYYNLGPVATWGKQDILVIDTLTSASQNAMLEVLALNGRLATKVEIQDYDEAMRMVEGLLALLFSDTIKCNVLVLSHILYTEVGSGLIKGFPNTIGQKLSPKVPRYFNNVIRVARKGDGSMAKRFIQTVSFGGVELKNSNPTLSPELEFSGVNGGLATVFQTIVGDPPSKWPKASSSTVATGVTK